MIENLDLNQIIFILAVMAASAVTTLPVLLLFLPIQSKIASGLTSASVKG